MIEFKMGSDVTADQLMAASEKLRAMANGLSVPQQATAETKSMLETKAVDWSEHSAEVAAKQAAKQQVVQDAADNAIKSVDDSSLKTGSYTVTAGTDVSPQGFDFTDLDADGAPYDSEIHASTKTKTAKGIWKKVRGVDAEMYESRTANNIQLAKQNTSGETEQSADDVFGAEPERTLEEDFAALPEPSADDVFGGGEIQSNTDWPPFQKNEATAQPVEETVEPITHEQLMTKTVGHLTGGKISVPEISAILKQYPGIDGSVAPHLGALSSAVHEPNIESIRAAIEANLAMKGVSW